MLVLSSFESHLLFLFAITPWNVLFHEKEIILYNRDNFSELSLELNKEKSEICHFIHFLHHFLHSFSVID